VAPPGSFARYLNSPREPGNEGALLERAVGLPLDRIEQELLRYRQRDLLNYMQIALDELPAVAAPTVQPASTTEALARLGELLASQGERRRAEAAQHFAAAGVEMPSAAPAAGTLDPAGPTNRNIVIVERPGPTDELDELRAAAEAEPDSLERWRRALALGQAANESSAARIALLEPLVARFPAELDLRLELAQLELVAGDEQRSAAHARIVLRDAPAGDRTIGPAAAIVAREVTNRALALGEDGRLRQAVELLSETIDGRPPLPEGDALSSLRSTRETLLEQLQIAEYNRAVELTRAKDYDAAARVLRTLLDEGAGPTEQNARALLTKIEEYVRLTRG
jgi:tetratricopeptide (TPR) repeat protein